jgi:hypothetical protein
MITLKVIYCGLGFMGSCHAQEIKLYNPNMEYCEKMGIFEMAKLVIPDGYTIKNWKCKQ